MSRHSNQAVKAFDETFRGAIISVVLLALVNAFGKLPGFPLWSILIVYVADFAIGVIGSYLLGNKEPILPIVGTVAAYVLLLAARILSLFDFLIVIIAFIIGLYFRFSGSKNSFGF